MISLLTCTLDLVSLQSLPLFGLFLRGECTPLLLSVVCELKLSRCFSFYFIIHYRENLFWSYTSSVCSQIHPLRQNCALALPETGLKFFNIRIWVSVGTDEVFNLEFKISCELTAALGFPTSLPPTDKSQLSSFQRFLSYHQALSLATELVLFPLVVMTLKLSLRGVSAVVEDQDNTWHGWAGLERQGHY